MRKGDHLSNQLVIILMLDIYFELDSSVKLKIITRLRNRPISSETHRMVLRSEAANRLHSWCGCSQNSMES